MGNINPIFSRIGAIGGATIANSANTDSTGVGTIGTTMTLAFTSDANNGSYVQKVRFMPQATAFNTTAATVLRVYISNKASGNTTATDTHLIQEITAPAQGCGNTTVAAQYQEILVGVALPANYTVLVNASTAFNANTSWKATVFAGNY